MGTLVATGLDAPVKLGRVLEAGGHVAMLVDQYYVNGVDVTFFGRRCKANPFIARLARHTPVVQGDAIGADLAQGRHVLGVAEHM